MPPPADIAQLITDVDDLATEVRELKAVVCLLLRLTESILIETAPDDLSIPRLQQEQEKLKAPLKRD